MEKRSLLASQSVPDREAHEGDRRHSFTLSRMLGSKA